MPPDDLIARLRAIAADTHSRTSPEELAAIGAAAAELERLRASNAALIVAADEAEEYLADIVAYGPTRLDKDEVRKKLRAAIAGANPDRGTPTQD